jgi:hypothetical protein
MAKATPPKSSAGSARIRFIMLEAEIPEGDLSQFTHAIQHALRPTTITVASPRISSSPTQRVPEHVNDVEVNAEASTIETATEEPESAGDEAPTRTPRKSAPRSPKVLVDVDLTSDPSFAAFANETKPDSHLKRNLVVAAWFKQARRVDAITMDHVYTCYRSVKWPSDIPDFGSSLRALKRNQKMTQSDQGFVINHLGIQEVDDLRKG